MAQYASTTINSATPAVDLMSWLGTQLTDNGWEFVETWTSGTKVANVYKSSSVSNSVSSDFYVATYRAATDSTSVIVLLFEDWDAVNKKAKKYAPVSGAGITVDVADNTVTDAVGVLLDSATLQRQVSIPVRVSISTTYVSDITINRIIVAPTNYLPNDVSVVVYAGVFNSVLQTSADPVPLVLLNFRGHFSTYQSKNYGSSTREPGAPTTATYNFNVQQFHLSTTSYRHYANGPSTYTATNSAAVLTTGGDLYRGYTAAPITFVSSRVTPDTVTSAIRGELQGVVTSMRGGAQGDTLSVTMNDASVRSYVLVQVATSSTCHVFVRTA